MLMSYCQQSFFLNYVFVWDLWQLFGWDLKLLWQNTRKQLICELVRTGRFGEAFTTYESMIEICDEAAKSSLRAWFASKS
jgi:pentatricopeptide repeat protein